MMKRTDPGIASLWEETAELATRMPRLEGDSRADVDIVGGGYSGLSAAHALRQRGIHPLVLEANAIGWGGSGRNGGVVALLLPMYRQLQTHRMDSPPSTRLRWEAMGKGSARDDDGI